MIHRLEVHTTQRIQMVDITHQVAHLVTEAQLRNGYVILFVPHTTAAITINEGADPDVAADILQTMQHLIPHTHSYRHTEGNSDAHIKASLIGPSQLVLVRDTQLVLGTWQHIFFVEGDGPRERHVLVTCVSAGA
jgi:secondary thiamine-phosphate synthase enzyme